MTEEIIIDKENKTKKHRNNEIDCLHFGCRKGENGNVLFWCDFYDDHCDNYTGCYYRKYLRLEQECEKLKEYIKDLQTRKDRYYLQVLEYERQVNDWISFYIKVRDIVAGNYEMLESQGLQDLRRIINEVEK